MQGIRVAVAFGAVLTALSLPASTGALGTADVQSGIELPSSTGAKHAKLDSALARLTDAKRNQGRTVRVEALARGGRRAELEAVIRAAGGTTGEHYGGLLEARLPVRALESVAAHPAARRLRTPVRPHAQVVGEGVGSSGAAAWHSAQTNGAGVEIAIVDIGFRGWNTLPTGELPAQVATADFCSAGFFAGPEADDHGTAVAEIVHELAPAAKLHLVCVEDLISLAQAKDYVVANDIPIVNHSIGWLNTSRGDGTGGPLTPDAIVADARAQGVLWVNAAGNYGDAHWSGQFSDPNANAAHNFAAPGVAEDEANGVFLFEGGCVFLKWDDWPASDQDFDLLLFHPSNPAVPIAVSDDPQTGSQEPVEMVCVEDEDTYYVAIAKFQASQSPRFDLIVTDGGALDYAVPAGSLVEPASSPAALAAGAVCWQNGALEEYSSRGPTIDARVKPDIAGQDANATTTYGGSNGCDAGFGGTSAGAAHVTGAAALLKQANPAFGPAELQASLESRAFDLGPTGKDNDSGAGRLALGATPPPPSSTPLNLALPTISGLSHQGQTLTASDGGWTGGSVVLFTFRWLRCDEAGNACVPIAGARTRAYVPTVADLGRRLRVRVTAFNTGGAVQAVSEQTLQIQAPVQPPANVISPSLAGVAQFGQVVSASSGAWSGTSPLTITTEWLRCDPNGAGCAVIEGAVATTRQLGLEDIGFTVRIRVTAANAAGSSAVLSAPTGIVLPPVPANLTSPTIAGGAVQGRTLTATVGAWSFATTFSIQWRRCTADGTTCTDLPGASAASYAPGPADTGGRLQVVVTATNAAGRSSAASTPTEAVARAPVTPPQDPGAEPTIRLIVLGFSREPRTPQAGRRFTLVLRVGTRATSSLRAARRVSCSAKIGRRSLRAAKSIRAGVARCAWALPRTAAGKRLRSTIVVSEGARSVRRTATATVRAARLR